MIYLLSLLIAIFIYSFLIGFIKYVVVGKERKVIQAKQSKIIELYGYVPKAVKK